MSATGRRARRAVFDLDARADSFQRVDQRRARWVDYVAQAQFGVGDEESRDDEERRRREVARDGVAPERAERLPPRDRDSFAGFGP